MRSDNPSAARRRDRDRVRHLRWLRSALGACVFVFGCDGSPRSAVSGDDAYARVCANCHRENGRGMPPAYRSLVGSSWATGAADRAIAIAVFGVQAPVTDGAVSYRSTMMPYGSGAPLSDSAVAAAVTHVRSSWGNRASAVTAADVARVRNRFSGRSKGFTQAELNGWSAPR